MLNTRNITTRINSLVNFVYKSANSDIISLDTEKRAVFIFSYSSLERRAEVKSFKSNSFDKLKIQLEKYINKEMLTKSNNIFDYMKLELVVNYKNYSKEIFEELLMKTKRNYFAFGIGFDKEMNHVISRDEINGWCLLYSSNSQSCILRTDNLMNYFNKTSKLVEPRIINEFTNIYLFNTVGAYSDKENSGLLLQANSYNMLREECKYPSMASLKKIICKSTEYLASQIGIDGKYTYGRWPCFDKKIPSYNMLRHFSSTYALVEGWEISDNDTHIKSALRAIKWGISYGFYNQNINNEILCFLKEENGELKLGGTAHAIIAISKYTLASKDNQFVHYLPSLLKALLFFQKEDGKLIHVLESSSLMVKDEFRTIYYDGEALYALLISYKIYKNNTYLEKAKELAQYFINNKYEKYHDHWQAYAFRELYSLTRDERYILFLIENLNGYLDFIKKRITTYPTLLELCVASFESFDQAHKNKSLDKSFNTEAFIGAMIQRAEYLLNGFFLPETAMHFKNPSSVVESFFIRHHGFRTRIDDNEHYISGLSGFYTLLQKRLSSLDPYLSTLNVHKIEELRILKLSMRQTSLVVQNRKNCLESDNKEFSNTVIKLSPYKKLPYLIYSYLLTKKNDRFWNFKFIMPEIKYVKKLEKSTCIESNWLIFKNSTKLSTHKYGNSTIIVDAIADFNFYFTSNIEFKHTKRAIRDKSLSISREIINSLFSSDFSAKELNKLYDIIYDLHFKISNLANKYVDTNLACICHNDLTPSNVGVISNSPDMANSCLAIIDIDNAVSGNWGQDLRFLLRENLDDLDIKTQHLSVCNQYTRRLNEHGIKLSNEHVYYSSIFEFAHKSFDIHRQKPQRQKIDTLKNAIDAITILI